MLLVLVVAVTVKAFGLLSGAELSEDIVLLELVLDVTMLVVVDATFEVELEEAVGLGLRNQDAFAKPVVLVVFVKGT